MSAPPRGAERSFAYDALYRLTGSTGKFLGPRGDEHRDELSLGYDRIHNLTHKSQEHVRHTPGGASVEQHETTYDWRYSYTSARPHAPVLLSPHATLTQLLSPHATLTQPPRDAPRTVFRKTHNTSTFLDST